MALTSTDIQRAFQNSLGRAATTDDVNSYVAVSNSGALTDAQIYASISNSREADLNADPVVRFYQAAFGRVPDQAGLDNATDYVRSFGASAATYQNLSNMFAQSQEFINRFGSGTTVDAAYVQALYSTILGRSASSAEVDGYVSGAAGYTTRGAVLYAVSQSQEAIAISNSAVNGFLFNAAEGDAVYTGSLYTPANGQPSTPGGQAIVLTTAIDSLVGTENGDTFNGTISTNVLGSSGTFNTGDSINGGNGTDTLSIIAASGDTVVPANLTSVEVIRVQSLANSTIDLGNATGVTTLAVGNSATNNTTTFSNVKAIADIQINNTGTGSANITVGYAAATVAGLNDAQKITLNNGAGVVDVAGVETANIVATGVNSLSLTPRAFEEINVSGSGSLTFTRAIDDDVTTLNASASTGNITATIQAGGDIAVTGGSGNDSFDFGTGLTIADTVDGGTGTDTVRVTIADTVAARDLSSAASAAPFNNLEAIERVAFDGAGVTLNGSTFTNTGITFLQFNTTGDDFINNAGSARTYEFTDTNGGAASFNLKTGATTLNIDLLGTAGTAEANDGLSADLTALTVRTAGATSTTTPVTINLTSAGDLRDGFFDNINAGDGTATVAAPADRQINETGLVTVSSGSTVNVDGDGNLGIFGGTTGAVTAGFSNNVTLDTSALTGNTILAGSDVGANQGNGNTSTTTGVDTFNLGAGKDVIVFHSGAASGVTELATVGGVNAQATGNILVDTINNFTAGSGGDVLVRGVNLGTTNAGAEANYTALQSATQAQINNLAGATATLAQAANLASNDAATNWTAFSFQGSTYALFDAAQSADAGYASGTDNLVKLTGVTVASLTDANFSVGTIAVA